MVLINIEKLSDSELRYIAQQGNLEGWDSMDRQDLIDELSELYSDDGFPTERVGGLGAKYSKSLTTLQSEQNIGLPGVNPVPETYNENSIHLVQRDSDWAYVIWNMTDAIRSLAENDRNASIFLRMKTSSAQRQETFEVEVNADDSDWLLELPFMNCEYCISLVLKQGTRESVLASSNTIRTGRLWYEDNCMDLDEDAKELAFRPLISREERLTHNKIVHRIFDKAGGRM